MSRKLKSYKAATLIEVVLMLPLFLLGILFILWISYIINTKNSLISAVENGVRLASTRGKAGLYEGILDNGNKAGAIKPLEEFIRGIITNLPPPYRDLLEHNAKGTDVLQSYDQKVEQVFGDMLDQTGSHIKKLNQLPPHYAYSIAYINKAMRITYGDNISYPCDPRSEAAKNSDNCLICYPVNPRTMDLTLVVPQSAGAATGDTFSRGDEAIVRTRMAIRCDLKPGGFITNVIVRLLNYINRESSGFGQDGVMTYYTYFDSYEECKILKYTSTSDSGVFYRYCCKDYNGNDYCF